MVLSVLGLIVEYNPLHNGHLYHFNTSLDITQANYSICVMSGNFVQRGEPAIVDKWERTKMALNAKIDLVIELPIIYSMQSAEYFAFGAVSILNKLGVVDTISFGSETGDIEALTQISKIIANEPSQYKTYLKEEMNKGNSFASSRATAITKYINDNNILLKNKDEIYNILKSSNNILSFEYIKWLIRLKSTIKPVTIKRINSNYNDEFVNETLKSASATAIRNSLKTSDLSLLNFYMPDFTTKILKESFLNGKGPIYFDNISDNLIYILRRMPLNELSNIIDVKEGLEFRIKKAALECTNADDIIKYIKSKRYTETRIKRILINCLLGIYKNDLISFNNAGGPQYIRILGFSQKGREILSRIKNKCSIPIITNAADYRKYNNIFLKKMFELDILATDIYVSLFKNRNLKKGGYDFYNKPIILNE